MKIEKNGNTVTITVDLDKNPKPSSTGKSLIVFTSHGFQWVEDLGVNLTIIRHR
jgi:hypothetical protein